jgi:hypothetical protein
MLRGDISIRTPIAPEKREKRWLGPFTARATRLALLLFPIALGTALCAQSQPPTVLHEAAHCLVAGDRPWLDAQTLEAPELTLGYHLDTKTLLGDEYLYVIVYTAPLRNEGKIFDIRVKGHHGYSIENSARFVSSAKGIDFPEPPAGGQWAQTQYVSAIQEIQSHKWYRAPMKALLKPSKSIQCESNVEPNSGDTNSSDTNSGGK